MAITLSVTTGIFAKKEKILPPMDDFVTELMAKMTVQEKIVLVNHTRNRRKYTYDEKINALKKEIKAIMKHFIHFSILILVTT